MPQALLLDSCLSGPRCLRGLPELDDTDSAEQGVTTALRWAAPLPCPQGWVGSWDSREPLSTFSPSGRRLGLEADQGLHLVLRQPWGLELGGNGNSRLCSWYPDTSSTRSQQCACG